MQASAVLLFAFCLHASAATYSQTVSFTGKDVSLKTVFASVKKQTGFGFFYENGEEATLKGAGNVTLDLKNVALDLFLQVCLRNQPLEYSVEGTTVFVKRKEARSVVSVESSDSARIPEIRGRVTNDKGEPLVNANVVVKRTGRGTVTGANGNFTLHDVSSDDVITVSFIGYKAQAVPVRDRTSLTLVMESATNELDKMVVQAYGTTSQRLATGNIGVVRAEDIAKQPIMNVLQAIQGQVAGVDVTNTSGYASGTLKVEIRGRNTINPNAPSDPLYIIDGVPLTVLEVSGYSNYANGSQGFIQSGIAGPAGGQSPFFSVNPSDIESIEILKDADATAIYGSRGANGVILITTKKGKPGKTHFDFNLYSGISNVNRQYKMLNNEQYINMRREALKNDGLTPDINNAPDLLVWDTTRFTDWQKYLWGGTGKTTDIQASLTGGDARTTFRIAGGYRRQTEILTVSGANERTSFSLNVNHKSLNQRLNISLTGGYTYSSVNTIYIPSGAAVLAPNAPPVFDNHSNLNYAGWAPLQGYFNFSSLLQPFTSKTNFLNSNVLISYNILKGLFIKTSLGYNNAHAKQISLNPISSQNPDYNPTGYSAFGYNDIHNLIVEPQIEYNSFINKGRLNVLLGASSQANITEGIAMSGNGYQNDALITSINNAPSKSIRDNYAEYKYEALFGRINYNWSNKYILNANIRRDGSSRFGPGRQFGNFGSIGIAYIFSEEPGIKENLSYLSHGKLRGSYGTTGNDQIGDYQYLSQWYSGSFPYNGILPIIPTGHSDSLLQWEVNKKIEVALDLGFLNDWITLEASWYSNRCNNQLVPFPTPSFTGFNVVTANSPADVRNTGWEFVINSKLVETKQFKWSAKLNIGINRNKLIAYKNLDQSPYASMFVIGKSLNIQKLLHYQGVDKQSGLYSFQDLNHDNEITIDYSGKTSDDRYIYDMTPKFNGGFTTNFTYKHFDLSLFFYFKKQTGISALAPLTSPGSISNEPIEILNHWQKPGDNANVAKFTTNPWADPSYQRFQQSSDGIYCDASFIRLQNLSLSYAIPETILRKPGIQSLRIYIQASNLFLITSYKGIDPEVQNFGGLPLPRIVTAGFSCNF
jgi:TonB-linked SusC/RagA family outer membrane protein